jgi:cell wall-associated NlpC family hydrolase
MNKIISQLLFIFPLLFLLGCGMDRDKEAIDNLLLEARQKFAPDRRTIVFDVDAQLHGRTVMLAGEMHDADLKAQLIQFMKERTDHEIVDSLTLLPESRLGNTTIGLVTVSVANLRSTPSEGAELVSQVLLGTPLKVLKKRGGWYYAQIPDHYLGWLSNGFVLIDEDRYEAWARQPKIIVTMQYGFTYQSREKNSQVVSDVVIGSLLGLIKDSGTHYEVEYPDGRQAYLQKEDAEPYDRWIARAKDTPESVVSTAKRFMGIPYLWGGTSAKGFDCSGYTKTVFFLNGVLLPRDASQQVLIGEPIDMDTELENVEIGDLLFFGSKATGEKKERVTHVGIYLGNKKFIHASGDVRMNSLDPADADYSEYRHRTFLRAKRVIGAGENVGIRRLSELPYYRGHEL